MPMPPRYIEGQRVRVTQQVVRLDRPGGGTMTSVVEGTVVFFDQQKTGSWFAHSKDHKLWLDRLRIRKDDGELVTLNLDQNSSVEILADAPAIKPT